ncbi:DNA replication licensing factor [Wickerhamomyces ciferrii]|uniref:DNA replication licensing factor MCM2 n=1 Tax=Wickerhamomyces ciferrii (strain ATCC 14091 / BCRC 22168 / CBS 111 / JCM 3599 / NBRC 0793 / NRRL Y-1031 F-60-10) TaxID=1206466 RepID=K0KNP2_WICCF|nr:DNA replication licensing factor [Wickerhamomyces ciferrii]CCH43767.1 DNA replication licensing factor [Wickerhamomyces ciferrii]
MSQSRKRQAESDNDDDLNSGYASSHQSGNSPRQSGLLPSSPGALPFDDADDDRRELELDDFDERIEDEEDGVDLMDNFERDYRENAEEDHYDLGDNIDDDVVDTNDLGDYNAVTRQLNRRDEFLQGNHEFLDDGDDDRNAQFRRRRRNIYDEDQDMGDDGDIDPLEEELTLESLADVKAQSLTEWVTQPNVSRTIRRELKSFLLEYTDENGKSVYGARIRTLGEVNSESLEVSYNHLVESKAILAMFLAYCPEEMLKIFDVVAMEATELHYPDYSQIHSEIHVRISDFPTVSTLRELREGNLNTLVRVSGVVTRRTGVFPQLKYVKFDCLKCNSVLGPFFQDANSEVKISFCSNCKSKGPFRMNSEKTLYRNYQRVTLQEAPGTVPAGRLPRHREVILLWDLVDVAKPGEEIEVTGVYKNSFDGNLNVKNGFPVFATIIEANAVRRREGAQKAMNGEIDQGLDIFSWTEEEEREFRKLSRERGVIEKIISSVAPSIYGHKDIKTAIACSLFGGVPKNVNGKHSIRGDINVLLLGDPGTAKSQILKYVEKTAQRAVFATGQGASAVGLTASVRKDAITKEWTLEGGALVLADKGTCLIDEFDKMNDQDRTSIHEAMEQQSISISKAGIVTSLQARCAIIAAANPNGGKYNSTLPLSQNVDLTEPILSRFDILCVVKDVVNAASDERLARFVIDSHVRSNRSIDDEEDEEVDEDEEDEEMNDTQQDTPIHASRKNQRRNKISQLNKQKENEISPIPQDFLMKYIHYARTKIQPKLHQIDNDKIARLYSDLRRESITTGSFPITVRHLESVIRTAEAFAKMRLSEFVSQMDVDRAIKVSIDSFVGAQKLSVQKQLNRSFQKYNLERQKL